MNRSGWLAVSAVAVSVAVSACVPAGTDDPSPTTSKPTTTTAKPTTTTTTVPVDTDYTVTMRITGSPDQAEMAAVMQAKNRMESVIVGDVPDMSNTAGYQCQDTLPNPPATIDDVFVDVVFKPIDGAGGLLGQAGPCVIRTPSGLPITGIIMLDTADAADLASAGQLDETMLHELGHVVGIGTTWQYLGLLDGAGTANPTFNGAGASGEWHGLGGSGDVPVENQGGSGTRDSHWRESTFAKELMTGYLDSGVNPLSRMTIASLDDLGYRVDRAAADPFTLPSSLVALSAGERNHAEEIVRQPVTAVPERR